MSVNWAGIKHDVETMVAALTGLAANQVKWKEEAAGGTWALSPMIYLEIKSIKEVGYADERREFPDQHLSAQQTVEVVQQKRFILSIRCESFQQDIASPDHAGTIIGTLKTRMQRSTAIFDRGLFSVSLYGDTKWFDFKRDSRTVCCYVLDLTCGAVDSDTDTSADAGDWINEARIQGILPSSTFDPMNYIVGGYSIPLGAGLTKTPVPGQAVVGGVAVSSIPPAHTFVALTATYRELDQDGVLYYQQTAIGAPAPPVIFGCMRLGVTVTNATGVASDTYLAATPFLTGAGDPTISLDVSGGVAP